MKLIPLPTRDGTLSKATKQERRRYKRTVNTHKTRITRLRRKPRLGVFNQRHERAEKKRESSVKRSNQSGRSRQHKGRATSFSCRSKKGKFRKWSEVSSKANSCINSSNKKKIPKKLQGCRGVKSSKDMKRKLWATVFGCTGSEFLDSHEFGQVTRWRKLRWFPKEGHGVKVQTHQQPAGQCLQTLLTTPEKNTFFISKLPNSVAGGDFRQGNRLWPHLTASSSSHCPSSLFFLHSFYTV